MSFENPFGGFKNSQEKQPVFAEQFDEKYIEIAKRRHKIKSESGVFNNLQRVKSGGDLGLVRQSTMHRINYDLTVEQGNLSETSKKQILFFQGLIQTDPGLREVFKGVPLGVCDARVASLLQGAFEDKNITNTNVLSSVLGSFDSRFNAKVEDINSLIEEYKTSFFEKSITFHKNLGEEGFVSVHPMILKKRLDFMHTYVVDGFFDSRLGGFEPEGWSMQINSELGSKKKFRKTVFHEIVHALLSGQRMQVVTEGVFEKIEVSHFGFQIQEGEGSPKEQVWINEATTEEITQKYLGNKEGEDFAAYPFERFQLRALWQEGLSKKLTYDAFQENVGLKGVPEVGSAKELFYDEVDRIGGKDYIKRMSAS